MIDIKRIAVFIFLTSGFTLQVKAQFLNFNLVVETELSATVEQDLGFGSLVVNSGVNNISLGDPGMGVFSIRAIYTQNIYINLEFPDQLEPEGSTSTDFIPLDLRLAYNNSGSDNIRRARPLVGNSGFVAVSENTSSSQQQSVWRELYIYVYGSIDIGNIDSGNYSATVQLKIDYD